MAYINQTMECFPRPIMVSGKEIAPAPLVDHEHCPGHWSPGMGVMGGWICPCECHRNT